MKAVLIDPEAQTVTEVGYDGSLQAMRELIDANTIDIVRSSRGVDLVIDDDGLFTKKHYFTFISAPAVLAGKALITQTDEEGATVSLDNMTLAAASARTVFLSAEEAIETARLIEHQAEAGAGGTLPGFTIIKGPTASEIISDKVKNLSGALSNTADTSK